MSVGALQPAAVRPGRCTAAAGAGLWLGRVSRQKLDAVAPRVGGVETPHTRQLIVPLDRCASRHKAPGKVVQLFAGDCEGRVSLAGRREVLINANVELPVAESEPCGPAGTQGVWLLKLRQAEHAAEEGPRGGFASGRRGELHVIQKNRSRVAG